ncbi:IS982 family transposase [Chryseobacterium nematophagum]|uniref:IS982 family transposase n=1 Tax=Chryseobacterium nematophagum TaxID=2305228 RepID=A0A3M7LCF4_9FLAO|nr:IS982 family transposase [Chryseobacterium nematophagum]RMZ60207.1 IS982 family transposase [Chryseobacterium nematophagum]
MLEVLQELELDSENFLFQIRKPRLTDFRIIVINLTSEYMSIDSEYQLFRILPAEIKSLIERSVYNRRKRKLFNHMERIRKVLAEKFNGSEKYFVVDSMPLEVCKLSRSSRSRICKETDYALPNRGYYASQKMHYYGYKLHVVCSAEGVFQSLDISSASVHDIHYLKDIKQQLENCTILGDKGYLSAEYQLDLFTSYNIKLEVPMRKNQKNYKNHPYIIRKSRKRIETLFSQLCDQFMIRRNYVKSFLGFKTRILSKIVTLTIIQTINRNANRNINNLKINIT